MMRLLPSLLLLLLLLRPHAVDGQCHSLCSGHGSCSRDGSCACYSSWTGADCSRRTCPNGTAWVDYAVGDQQAHGPAECSNRGRCDRASGS